MMKKQALPSTLSVEDLAEAGDLLLIDVRTPSEFREKHISGSDLHPLHDLDPSQVRDKAQGRPVCLICRSGNRAQKAAERLAGEGLEVTVLSGGVLAWEAAGRPLNRGQGGISLERQVRIAAGALVLTGVIGSFWHPGFIALSGFVGAGLIFAGLTDWCGMGMLLARMPWNRQKPSCCQTRG